jgi:two-component system, OmpR family, sensor histidine kinase KdpD
MPAWHRIYMGYAPGVGKTFAMLREARQRKARGVDVVVGWAQTYNRPRTLEAIGDLELVPPRTLIHRSVPIEEMDLDGILARRPQLVLVDELAHTNVPGSRHQKRYQDVLALQAWGISIMSTLNFQQLASVQDTVRVVTGATVTETLPDWVVDAADELEMVDEPPAVVQKRVRRGNVLPREQIERALEGYFRTDSLMALRELTVRRIADHSRRTFSNGHAIESPDVGNETVLVCLPGSAQAQRVLRRGVQLADRLGARLVVVHVAQPGQTMRPEGSRGYQEAVKALQLARALGGEVRTHQAAHVAEALIQMAHETGATQVVLGEGSQARLHELFRGSVLREVLRRTRNVDVHIVRRVAE